jgi:VWFA-related protein
LILAFAWGALAQTQPAGAPPANAPEVRAHESAPPFQIRVETNLVTVKVVVRDAKGRPVAGLRKEDFRLFDSGKPQDITGFAAETAAAKAAAPEAVATPAPVAPNPPPATAPSPAAPVPQRFVALYFDDLHMDFGAVQQPRDAAWRYISTALRPEDRVAIFTSSNQVGIDFTDDRAKLHDALSRLAPHSRTDPLSQECPAIGEYQAYLIAERQDRNALDLAAEEARECCKTRGKCSGDFSQRAAEIWDRAALQSLDALEVADGVIRRVAAMPGQRILVLVSTGFLIATREREVGALIERALRQNVVVNAIDAAGLYAKTYPNVNLVRRPDLQSAKFRIENEGLSVQRDVLAGLTAGTGGAFFHNSNDFDDGFRQTAQAPEVSYVLSFSPADVKMDGKFHALKVTVDSGSGWDIQARRGYFANAETAPAKSELESLVFSQEEHQGLPATVTAQVGASAVTVKIHVDIQALQFRKEADRSLDTLILETALFDRDGKYVAGKESTVDFRLTDAKLEQLLKSGMNTEIGFQIAPGTYRIREVVRDTGTKKLAALNYNIEVTAAPPVQAAVLPAAPARPAKHKEEKKTKSMLDWSMAQFEKAMPELRGLEPAESQERLAVLLQRTGENVKSFFDVLPNTTARERIDLERLLSTEHRTEEFNYLALPRPGKDGVALDEYRTNAAGKRAEPKALQHGFVTTGFVSMIIQFHPLYLSESQFRYLGRQNMDGHPTDVVFFAQIPGKARVKESLRTQFRSLEITLQGVAWIDSDTYHIVRMRTELEPRADLDLKEETTESRFTEVRFKDVPQAFWLPEEVTVTVNWDGAVFRNRHRYSDFQLFRVDTDAAPPRSPARN